MKQSLIRLGLTDREAEAYLALYNFKETTATQLAKITKEHRTNIYDSLNGLIKKGLITYNIKNNVKHYQTADPEKLTDFIKEKEHIATTIIPELKSKINSVSEKPIIEIYEGKEGFKSILSKILREGKTIYGIGASGEWEKRFPIKLEQYMKERERKKIHAKLLYVKGTKPIKSKVNKYKFLPIEYSQPSTIAIFGDYVATVMWTEPMVATLTKSKELAESFINYFNLLWKLAKP
tara:strand:+ start:880 stop:1584 length:705 start_codon:yes stop_codon:yes gene_type:complete